MRVWGTYHGRQNNDLLRTGHRRVCVSLVEIVEDRGQRTQGQIALFQAGPYMNETT